MPIAKLPRSRPLACLALLTVLSCLAAQRSAAAEQQQAVAPRPATALDTLLRALRRRGFTVAEVNAFKLTQVTPHYERFAAWQRCMNRAVDAAVLQSVNLSTARQVSILLCEEDSELVRASIAREIGVDRAARVRTMLDTITDLVAVHRWSARPQQAVPPPRAGTRKLTAPVQIGRWLIKPAPGGCRADYLGNGRKAPRAAMVQDGKTIQLWIGSEDILWTSQDPPLVQIVTVEAGAATVDIIREFALKYEPGVIWLHTRMSESNLTDLAEATGLRLAVRGPNFGNPRDHDELFAFAPIAPILDTLRDC